MEQPEETETTDDIAVHELQAGDADGAAIVFCFNGRHVSVSIFPAISYFRLEAAAGRSSVIPIEASEAYASLTIDPILDGCVDEEIDVDPSLPRYVPEIIAITKVFLQGMSSVAASVQVHGRDMFCEARGQANGLYGTSEGQELECLEKMRSAFPRQGTVLIPQILGYVQHGETKHILGLLRHWVPGRRLSEIKVSSVAIETRRKWMSQIRGSLQRLHEQGLVWRDGKTSNIIIDDERDDAWLIDCGGGFTDGWVDEELSETMEGDEQALGKITKFLDLASSEEAVN